MKHNLDLQTWKPDGEGGVLSPADGEFEVSVHTPFTLWCRTPVPADFEIAFECHLQTPNAAMLLMACARDWRGGDFLRAKRRGDYDEYNAGALEMYTLGFNRTGNVSDEVQPNASTANLRRIGGPHFTQYQGLSLANRDEAAMRLWHEWDRASLLASVREFASGTDRFFSYRVRFHHPKITFALQGEELFTVVDHRAEPLRGGYVGLRCMTPGARYRLRNLRIADDVE
jgi:hypothetical protein